MDFNDTPEESNFRSEVREWLTRNAPAYVIDSRSLKLEEIAQLGRGWQAHKAKDGYGALKLPQNLGGRAATPMQEVIFAEEEGRYELPIGVFTSIGTNLVLPTLLQHGSPEQVEKFIRPTVNGELQWCQLFSEPAAGSDLAGVRTKAVRDGDDWVITGQKVWNSWAQVADWGVLMARTDPGVAKHKGITYFVIDMKTPGVEVRPIQQISGESEFNEVFLTEVRVPDTQRVDAVGAGWKVAMTTLMNERASAVAESAHLPDTRDVISAASESDCGDLVVQQAARMITQEMGLKNYRNRLLTLLSQGRMPGADVAMAKLVYGKLLQDISALSLELQGLSGLFPNDDERRTANRLQHGYCWGAALRIAGGADEVLRNQLAERVLGLPADLRVDKDLAYNQIPIGR